MPDIELGDIAEQADNSATSHVACRRPFSIHSTLPLDTDENEISGRAKPTFVKHALTRLWHLSFVHHWYWPAACVALLLIGAQVGAMDKSLLLEMIAKSIVIYTTFTISVVEQATAAVLRIRRVSMTEITTSIFVLLCSSVAWTFWALRHRNPRFAFVGSACFQIIEVALLTRFAYGALVGKYELGPSIEKPACCSPNNLESAATPADRRGVRHSAKNSTPYQEWYRNSASSRSKRSTSSSLSSASTLP